MFVYEKKLQYPVKIATPNAKLASFIISQYGGRYTIYLRNTKSHLRKQVAFPLRNTQFFFQSFLQDGRKVYSCLFRICIKPRRNGAIFLYDP